MATLVVVALRVTVRAFVKKPAGGRIETVVGGASEHLPALLAA